MYIFITPPQITVVEIWRDIIIYKKSTEKYNWNLVVAKSLFFFFFGIFRLNMSDANVDGHISISQKMINNKVTPNQSISKLLVYLYL